MLKLYHNPISTCSQKVRFVLAEKGLAYETHELDLIAGDQHQDWYVKLNPKHVVPTIEHDGRVLTESSLIIQYLDGLSESNPLTPADPYERYRLGKWTRLVDEEVHPNAGTVTFAVGPRKMLLAQPEEAREAHIASIPDPARRALRRSVIEHGVNAPEFGAALGAFIKMLDLMEGDLASSKWLLGDQLTLADANVLPYVVRLDDLAFDGLFASRPNAQRWYADLQKLPSFDAAVTQWTPQPLRDMFKANGREVWPEISALLT